MSIIKISDILQQKFEGDLTSIHQVIEQLKAANYPLKVSAGKKTIPVQIYSVKAFSELTTVECITAPLDKQKWRSIKEVNLNCFVNQHNCFSLPARLVDVVDDGDITKLYLTFPNYLDFHERRQHPRTLVGGDKHLAVVFNITEKYQLTGRLWEISAGGLQVFFPQTLDQGFKAGDIIEHCEVELDNGVKMSCRFEVRWLGIEKSEQETRIGGRFLDLDKTQNLLLHYFITRLEQSS